LTRKIEIIQPAVIATLGRFSMEFILKKFDVPQQNDKISRLHGQVIPAQAAYGEIHIVPLYHPAVALYRSDQRKVLEEDFQALIPFAHGDA
ncbi:MAG: uracil-DNA glycosylase family protein, partial [Anaerolineales bacterium]